MRFQALTVAMATVSSSADLARFALVTPQTLSVIVTNLLKAGLVVRTPHQVHGRIQSIALTEAGDATLKAAKQGVYALEAGCCVISRPRRRRRSVSG